MPFQFVSEKSRCLLQGDDQYERQWILKISFLQDCHKVTVPSSCLSIRDVELWFTPSSIMRMVFRNLHCFQLIFLFSFIQPWGKASDKNKCSLCRLVIKEKKTKQMGLPQYLLFLLSDHSTETRFHKRPQGNGAW